MNENNDKKNSSGNFGTKMYHYNKTVFQTRINQSFEDKYRQSNGIF